MRRFPLRLGEFLAERSPEEFGKATKSIAEGCINVWENIPFKTGLLPSTNPSGEKQAALDVFANDVFVQGLLSTGAVAEVSSEEMDSKVSGRGSLCVGMDPLDGSSNVDTNNPLGSIFGFYSQPLPCSGRRLIGSAFVTYGAMVTLTLSFGTGVDRFVAVRDKSEYEFELMDEKIRIPDTPEVYGFGGQRKDWIDPVQRFVASIEERGLKTRYCGTFVGDYNQVLKRGGIFAYPALKDRPQGKLRVLFETAPMGYLTEQAGGYASDGRRCVLDIEPKLLSETSPAYFGSEPLVRELEALVSKG